MSKLSEAAYRTEALELVATTLVGRTSRLARLLMRPGSRELSRTEAGLLSTLAEGSQAHHRVGGDRGVGPAVGEQDGRQARSRHLVVRQRTADDGRAVVVSISAEGRLRLESARSQIRSLLRRTLLELEDEELAALVAAGDVLERLIQLLQRGATVT